MACLDVTPPLGAPLYGACLHALLRSLAIVAVRGLGRSGSESGPSVYDLGPFLGSSVQTIVHVISLRGAFVSLVRNAFFSLCFQQDVISKVYPPTNVCNSTLVFVLRFGPTCCANARNFQPIL